MNWKWVYGPFVDPHFYALTGPSRARIHMRLQDIMSTPVAERPIEQTTAWTLRGRGPRKRRPNADRQGLAYSR